MANTVLGVSNNLLGVSNTRLGVSNTRLSVSNTLLGVSKTLLALSGQLTCSRESRLWWTISGAYDRRFDSCILRDAASDMSHRPGANPARIRHDRRFDSCDRHHMGSARDQLPTPWDQQYDRRFDSCDRHHMGSATLHSSTSTARGAYDRRFDSCHNVDLRL